MVGVKIERYGYCQSCGAGVDPEWEEASRQRHDAAVNRAQKGKGPSPGRHEPARSPEPIVRFGAGCNGLFRPMELCVPCFRVLLTVGREKLEEVV